VEVGKFVINNSSTDLRRFLLTYRRRRTISTLVIEATSLADALVRAQGIGGDQFQFRMVQALDPDLAKLVRPEQVNRALSPAEAKQLLALFSVRSLHHRSGTNVLRPRSPRSNTGNADPGLLLMR
jgi:hypothetical protein